MKVLITGGAGFVGKRVIRALKGRHEARVFDLRRAEAEVETVVGDITRFEEVSKAVDGMDAVVHLAVGGSEDDPWSRFEVVAKGMLNVLEACVRGGVRRVVAASSINAMGYGGPQTTVYAPLYVPVDEEHPCRPDSLVGACKLAAEELCRRYTRRHGLSTLCLRLGRVGSEQNPALYPGAVPPEDTSVRREVLWGAVDVNDVAQAFRLALEVGSGVQLPPSVGSATPSQLGEHETFIITAETAFAPRPSLELLREHFPETRCIRDYAGYLRQPHKGLFSIEKAKAKLGYSPRTNFGG